MTLEWMPIGGAKLSSSPVDVTRRPPERAGDWCDDADLKKPTNRRKAPSGTSFRDLAGGCSERFLSEVRRKTVG